jgi:hypothetical protein
MPTGSATYVLGHQRRLIEQLDTLELELSVIDLKNTFWYSRDNVQSKFQPALPLDKDTENKLVYSRKPVRIMYKDICLETKEIAR